MPVKFNIGGVIIEMESEQVSKAIEAGELKIETDKLIPKTDDSIIYSKDDFELFKTNLANDEYKKGKTAGIEMTVKEAREKHGLDFEGKTLDNFTDAYKAKVLSEAKIEPTKKIQELENDKIKLNETLKSIETEFTDYKQSISQRETRQAKDGKLSSFIPSEGVIVSNDIAVMALKSKLGIDVDIDGGKAFIMKNGERIKDEKTRSEVELSEDFIVDSLNSIDLIKKPSGGRGGDDDTGSHKEGGYDAFVKEMISKDIESGTEEFNVEMNKRLADKTLVM